MQSACVAENQWQWNLAINYTKCHATHVGNELVIKIALYIHMYAHVCVLSMHVCSTCPNKSDKS